MFCLLLKLEDYDTDLLIVLNAPQNESIVEADFQNMIRSLKIEDLHILFG